MRCERFSELLPAYLAERLDEATRRDLRRHLAACASCRREAGAREPSLLLVGREAPVPPERIEAVVTGVRAAVRQRRLEARLAAGRRRVLAAAAVLLAAGLGGLALLGGGGEAPRAASAPPVVEVEAGPDATVYRPAVADGDTAVAFVVDPGLEL